MTLIDAHHHLWDVDHGYPWLDEPAMAPIRRTFTPADLGPHLREHGVTATVLVEGGRCRSDEARVLLAHAAATPWITGVVAWADPTDPWLARTLARYRSLPGGEYLVGVRPQVQAEPDPAYLRRPDVLDGLRLVADAGLAVDLVVRPDQLAGAASAAAAVPGLRLVLDHLGKPDIAAGAAGMDAWRGPLATLAERPNVTAKLSGLTTQADPRAWTIDDLRPYVAYALAVFGPGRLMRGSDWPVCRLAGGYAPAWLALDRLLAGLPADGRAAIGGGTAARVYGLPAPAAEPADSLEWPG